VALTAGAGPGVLFDRVSASLAQRPDGHFTGGLGAVAGPLVVRGVNLGGYSAASAGPSVALPARPVRLGISSLPAAVPPLRRSVACRGTQARGCRPAARVGREGGSSGGWSGLHPGTGHVDMPAGIVGSAAEDLTVMRRLLRSSVRPRSGLGPPGKVSPDSPGM